MSKIVSSVIYHLKTVSKHKYYVFKCMNQCGHPLQGFLHDWSKFSPTEFGESIKFFQNGKRSPIDAAKEAQGYSLAWFHHRGRNKHHSQYWVDISFGEVKPCKMPWKYLLELICDGVAAGKVYQGQSWNQHAPLEHYHKRDSLSFYHPDNRKALEECYKYIDKNGWEDFANKVKMGEIKY